MKPTIILTIAITAFAAFAIGLYMAAHPNANGSEDIGRLLKWHIFFNSK